MACTLLTERGKNGTEVIFCMLQDLLQSAFMNCCCHNLMWLRLYTTELNDRIYIFNFHICYTFWGIDLFAGMLQWVLCVFWVYILSFVFCFYINTEFQRLMTVPLEEKFMAPLDMHSSQLIKVIRAKGGAIRWKTADIMDALDRVNLYRQTRPFITKWSVTIYLYPSYEFLGL